MRIRHLLAVLLVLGLSATGAMATTWTVSPTAVTLDTGWTDYATKNAGEALIYGGASAGATRAQSGWFKFDTTAVPDATVITAVTVHFYVNAANWPWFKFTPVSNDPVLIASNAQVLWDDIQAEVLVGFYNDFQEDSTYAPGWKTAMMGGNAAADFTAGLGANWFAFGATEYYGSPTFFVEIDGVGDPNLPYLVVEDVPSPANNTCAGAFPIPGTPGSTTYTGDTTYATNDYDCNASCVNGFNHSEKDVTYYITLPANCTVCVTLNQSAMTWNGGVYMVTDCANVDGTCVAGASGWLAGGLDETFCYSATSTETYYIIVDGRTSGGFGTFQLDVDVSCLVPPTDLTCTENGADVDLTWTNNDSYDSIDVYEDDILVATIAGTSTSYTVPGVAKGYHCYHLCATMGVDYSCSDVCCVIFGYDNVEVLWDFEADDGGFVVDGTGAWEWGDPTYGPCEATAEGNVWATDLNANYVDNACWLLDSGEITLSAKGGFVCFDHCYDIEAGWDGGVVWFTTDDFWYYNFEPLDGTDGQIAANPICTWVAGRNGFTGNSGGWVTDCWDFTNPMWSSETVKIRFAFGSDNSAALSGWMLDNITVYNNEAEGTIDCDYTITPLAGTVSFWTNHNVQLINLDTSTRRIAGRIVVLVASGTTYNPWKFGFTNVAAGSSYVTAWNTNIPALGTVIGNNIFTLFAEDITPAPYNQPPFAPSGDQCTKVNVVVANAP